MSATNEEKLFILGERKHWSKDGSSLFDESSRLLTRISRRALGDSMSLPSFNNEPFPEVLLQIRTNNRDTSFGVRTTVSPLVCCLDLISQRGEFSLLLHESPSLKRFTDMNSSSGSSTIFSKAGSDLDCSSVAVEEDDGGVGGGNSNTFSEDRQS